MVNGQTTITIPTFDSCGYFITRTWISDRWAGDVSIEEWSISVNAFDPGYVGYKPSDAVNLSDILDDSG